MQWVFLTVGLNIDATSNHHFDAEYFCATTLLLFGMAPHERRSIPTVGMVPYWVARNPVVACRTPQQSHPPPPLFFFSLQGFPSNSQLEQLSEYSNSRGPERNRRPGEPTRYIVACPEHAGVHLRLACCTKATSRAINFHAQRDAIFQNLAILRASSLPVPCPWESSSTAGQLFDTSRCWERTHRLGERWGRNVLAVCCWLARPQCTKKLNRMCLCAAEQTAFLSR